MFKRFDDPSHWAVYIPLGFRRWMSAWDIGNDLPAWGQYRRTLTITLKVQRLGPYMREIRFRVGVLYL
jgi:hypothetical protein